MSIPFQSLAETPEGVLADLGRHMAQTYQKDDLIPANVGVNSPLFPTNPRNGSDLVEAMGGWFSQQRIRQGGHALDTPRTPSGGLYADRRFEFVAVEEGIRETAYDDATGRSMVPGAQKRGNVTVGIGFNMERPDARNVWQQVFPDGGPDFEAVYEGRARLNRAQVRALFDHTINEAESIVNNRFRGVDLREGQRLALVSMAFNGPALIGPRITAAVREGRHDDAVRMIASASDARQPVLAPRRRREARIYSGTEV
jgi:GH24 family phage-related lysozyme (muramidase)